MSPRTAILILAIFVILMPFLGFPEEIKTIFFVVAGFIIVALTYFQTPLYCAHCGELLDAKDRHEEKQQGPENISSAHTPHVSSEVAMVDEPKSAQSTPTEQIIEKPAKPRRKPAARRVKKSEPSPEFVQELTQSVHASERVTLGEEEAVAVHD